MMPSPPAIVLSMTGTDCTSSSRTTASYRPTFCAVTSAKRRAPSAVSEKPTAGRPPANGGTGVCGRRGLIGVGRGAQGVDGEVGELIVE
jgi:hypothetical protein